MVTSQPDTVDMTVTYFSAHRRLGPKSDADPVPDQVKKACIISNTPEPLKTHLQLNVGKLGNFNALRVATEDYLRSRRIFKTTSAGNTHDEDSPEKGQAKRNPARARRVVRKEKKPLRQRLRRNHNRTLTIRWRIVETVERVWIKSI